MNVSGNHYARMHFDAGLSRVVLQPASLRSNQNDRERARARERARERERKRHLDRQNQKLRPASPADSTSSRFGCNASRPRRSGLAFTRDLGTFELRIREHETPEAKLAAA